jgi:hypothetical protein
MSARGTAHVEVGRRPPGVRAGADLPPLKVDPVVFKPKGCTRGRPDLAAKTADKRRLVWRRLVHSVAGMLSRESVERQYHSTAKRT